MSKLPNNAVVQTAGSDSLAAAGHREHSTAEERFILLGLSAKLCILVVAHAYREDQGVIRIISARKATRRERDIYNQRWQA